MHGFPIPASTPPPDSDADYAYQMPEWQECITSYFKGEKQSLQEWDLRIGGYIFPTINENRILNVQLKLLDDYI